MKYWIFQYTTDVYRDVIKDLDSGKLCRWEVTKHRKNIKTGDTAVLYIGGSGAKFIYGTAEVSSDPAPIEDGRIFSGIGSIKKFENTVAFREAREKIPGIKIGISGTNFSCSREEFEQLISLGY